MRKERFINTGCYMIALLFSVCHSVNIHDPCDPTKAASAAAVFPSEEIEILTYYDDYKFDWIQTKLKYVNCSARGLNFVPSSIPNNVQMLDLSFNAIVTFGPHAFSRFTELIALSLAWNCPKSPSYNVFHCPNSTFLHKNAFSEVTKLKMLNLSNNIFKVFPKRLPSSIQHLDISSTAIISMSFDLVSFLDNLIVIVAESLCPIAVSDLCANAQIKLKPNTFGASNRSLKVLNFAFNNFFKQSISIFGYKKLVALNLAQTRISISKKFQFVNLKKLKYLNLNYLYPDEDTHVKLPEDDFEVLTNLEFLDLSNNMINQIPENLFRSNQNLVFLELSGNCLYRDIQNPTFLRDLRHLRFLYLGFNYCYSNPKNEMPEFNKPRGNVFLHLGSAFSTLSSLELLSFGLPQSGTNAIITEGRGLNFNTVNATSFLALTNLTSLHTLSIAYCKVRSFDIYALANLANLGCFGISHNFIESFTIDQRTSTIDSIDLEHLKKISVTSHVFNKSPSKIRLPMIASVTNRHKASQSKTEIFLSECNMNYSFDFSENSLTKLTHIMFVSNFSISNFTTWLDLSSNLIVTIRKHSFSNWKKICGINLKENPLRHIKHNAFENMPNLKYIIFNSTKLLDQTYKTLQFLNSIDNGFHLQMTNAHFFLHFKSNKSRIRVYARNALSVDLSENEIPSISRLEKAFLGFPNVASIKLKSCQISFVDFVLSNKLVNLFDLSNNKLPDLPTKTLGNMPKLKSLFLSKNLIVYLGENFAKLVPNLEELDLSHNRISHIDANVFKPAPKNLTKLWLNNNYLSQVSIQSFSKSFLKQILHFDLRWNAIGCDCSLTKTFGWWLLNSNFASKDRPGFTPICTHILDYNMGGCAKCQVPNIGTEVSLLTYSCNKSCQEFLPKVLFSIFLGCTLLLLLAGYIIISGGPKYKAWLSYHLLKDIISFKAETAKNKRQMFAFHAFVCFDLNDKVTDGWVENQLLPNIDSHCRVTIYGKNNHCGVPPTTQLLLKLEASRKTIVILSGNYGLSEECKYIISVLEYLEYRTGTKKLLVITFQNDKQIGGLLDKQRTIKPWSVLNVPDEQEKWPLLWKCLNTVILN